MAARAVLRAALRITGFGCLALLIAGLVTGGWLYRRYSSERAVIARFEACVNGYAVGRKLSGPAWLRRRAAFRSHPWMKTVTLIHATGGSLPDDVLADLRRLPDLIHVQLELVGLDDGNLVHLAALRNLRTLALSCPKVTDKGLRHLQGMTNLRRLHLTGTRVTFFGRRELHRALPNLIIRGG